MAARYDVDFLTTCSRSFLSPWGEDYFPAGKTKERAFDLYRFPVDDRSVDRFDELNAALLAMPRDDLRAHTARIDLPSHAAFLSENINSEELVNYIARERRRYLAFVFVPYLYGTTMRGIAAAGDKAYLQPCLHDEVYAYLKPVEHAFHQVRGLLFNSPGELEIARRIFGPGILHKSHLVGSGVEVLSAPEPATRLPAGLTPKRYFLCLGRRDTTKGVDMLVEAFRRTRSHENGFSLVLAGPGEQSYADPANGVLDLGFVSDAERASLLGGALALAQPSTNESFSRVMMESWAYRTPVIVDARCEATRDAVDTSGGGWIASGDAHWSDMIAHVTETSGDERKRVAELGRDYAVRVADWDSVLERYDEVFRGKSYVPKAPRRKTIHQVLETLEYGDAISNHAIALRDRLRERGYKSDILVRTVGELVSNEVRIFDEPTLKRADAIVYHHSTGSEMTEIVIKSKLPTAMIYHNITPSEYFARYRPELAVKLDEGRVQLAGLSNSFALSLGDSQFNADELLALGFKNVGVLPICLDYRRFDTDSDPGIARRLADGRNNILFVGRCAPNKAHVDLIEILARLHDSGSNTRLILAGRYDGNEAYFSELQALCAQRRVFDDILFTGLVTDADLLAYYRGSHIFMSMSDHEGFCVPLVEAMQFDLPIIAFGATAVAETMGDSGIVLNDKSDYEAIAALVRVLIGDDALREKVLVSQRKRREDFDSAKTLAMFDGYIDTLAGYIS